VASKVTGVLAAFLAKVTVTPEGILIVVKLKTPFGGSVNVVVAAGAKAPSAPVLPLLKVCACTTPAQTSASATLTTPINP